MTNDKDRWSFAPEIFGPSLARAFDPGFLLHIGVELRRILNDLAIVGCIKRKPIIVDFGRALDGKGTLFGRTAAHGIGHVHAQTYRNLKVDAT